MLIKFYLYRYHHHFYHHHHHHHPINRSSKREGTIEAPFDQEDSQGDRSTWTTVTNTQEHGKDR